MYCNCEELSKSHSRSNLYKLLLCMYVDHFDRKLILCTGTNTGGKDLAVKSGQSFYMAQTGKENQQGTPHFLRTPAEPRRKESILLATSALSSSKIPVLSKSCLPPEVKQSPQQNHLQQVSVVHVLLWHSRGCLFFVFRGYNCAAPLQHLATVS